MDLISLSTLPLLLAKSGVDLDLAEKIVTVKIGENNRIRIPLSGLIRVETPHSKIESALSEVFLKRNIFSDRAPNALSDCIKELDKIEIQIPGLKTDHDSYLN
jgi:hypothetical protein